MCSVTIMRVAEHFGIGGLDLSFPLRSMIQTLMIELILELASIAGSGSGCVCIPDYR